MKIVVGTDGQEAVAAPYSVKFEPDISHAYHATLELDAHELPRLTIKTFVSHADIEIPDDAVVIEPHCPLCKQAVPKEICKGAVYDTTTIGCTDETTDVV